MIINKISGFRNTYYNKLFYYSRYILEKELKDIKSILDIGCSNYTTLKLINFKAENLVGVDIFKPCIVKMKQLNLYSELYCSDALKFLKNSKSKSYDIILMIDFIEHVKYVHGIKIIKEAERVSRKKIIIVTPNGYTEHNCYHINNPYQKHISGWNAHDFEHIGFKVFGSDGTKYISRKIDNKYLKLLSFFLTPVYYPNMCNQIIAIKKI